MGRLPFVCWGVYGLPRPVVVPVRYTQRPIAVYQRALIRVVT